MSDMAVVDVLRSWRRSKSVLGSATAMTVNRASLLFEREELALKFDGKTGVAATKLALDRAIALAEVDSARIRKVVK